MRTRIAIASLAAISLAMMLRAGGFSFPIVFFGMWLLLPFFLAYKLVSPTVSILRSVIGIIACVLPAVGYATIAFPVGRPSSTAGLGFIFIPIWHFVTIGFCWLAA